MIKLKVNKIIKFLLISDLIFWTGWGLISPIFAVFIIEKIHGGDALVVGVTAAITAVCWLFCACPWVYTWMAVQVPKPTLRLRRWDC